LSPFAGLGGALGNAAASAVLDGFSSWLAAGAGALVKLVGSLISTTAPSLDAKWFVDGLESMVGIAAVVMAPLLFAASIGAIIHQDMKRLARTWGVALPVAVIVGMAAIPVTSEALAVTDALSNLVRQGLQPHLTTTLDRLGAGVAASGSPFLATIVAMVVIVGGLLLWLELLLRSAAIYVVVFFFPLALAGLVWPATAHWTKRMVELLVALILSKFVIVAALSLAVGAVGTARQAGQVIAGGAVLLMAGFAPFILLRLAPMVEAATIGHLEGASRRPFGAARSTASAALAAPHNPAVALLAAGRGGAASIDERTVGVRDMRSNGGELERDEAAAAARSSPAPARSSLAGTPGRPSPGGAVPPPERTPAGTAQGTGVGDSAAHDAAGRPDGAPVQSSSPSVAPAKSLTAGAGFSPVGDGQSGGEDAR
jgi:hypothetical protein